VIRIAIGLIGTMAALMLGLLISSAKGTYDAQQNRVMQLAAKVGFLDRALGNCGPEAEYARARLRLEVAREIARIWPSDSSNKIELEPDTGGGDALYSTIHRIPAANEEEQTAKEMALQTMTEIGQLNSMISAQAAMKLPRMLLIVVVSWLVLIFVSFGLFAKPNSTAIGALVASAIAVSSAIYLILELEAAFGGVIGISNEAMVSALEKLGG
jgi:hypothetical protein